MKLTYIVPVWVTTHQLDRTFSYLTNLACVLDVAITDVSLSNRNIIINVTETIIPNDILALGALIGQIQSPLNQ